MKRVMMALFSIVILFGVVWTEEIGQKGTMQGVTIKSQDEIDLICQGKEFFGFDTGVVFNDCPLGYDVNQNMLLIPQELEKNNFHGKLGSEEGELIFLEDEMWNSKMDAIASNHVFRLFRVTNDKYWMYNVYFTGMPVAQLSTEEIMENEENSGTMWVYDQYSQSNRYQTGKCRFRLRGASSMQFPKPSYKVTFTEKDYSLLGMREDDDWILNSLYDDEGLIHNKVSYELWQQIAGSNTIPYDEGISMEYIEVFVDNEYKGVYGLLERVDKKTLNLNAKDILYKGVDVGDVGLDDFYIELTEEMSPQFELKYPKDFTEKDWQPLKEWYYGLNYDKDIQYEIAKQSLNMENAIDYLLFNVFISGEDNLRKNVYYWADYQNDGSYRIIKIPWDVNMTWGNAWCEPHQYHFNVYQEKCVDRIWGWTEDMEYLYELNPEEIGQMMYNRWYELRKEIITQDNIYKMLDSQFHYIHSSGSYIRDSLFWGSREELWSDSYIYEYTHKKIQMMDEYINSLVIKD